MIENFGKLIVRKLKTTFLATFIFSMVWTCWEIKTDEEIVYYLGTHFYNMTLVYFCYIGFFVLIYGILASFVAESLQRKWFERTDWLYVSILGLFGSAIGVIFPFQAFILAGILVAVLFGIIDKWLLKRWFQNKGSKSLFTASIFIYILLGGLFWLTSPSLPAVTAADAVEFATYDNDTKTDDFPNEVGTWKGEVEGYKVERTTAVEQLEENRYLVIFTEKWQKETENGIWRTSYEVDLGSISLHDEEGNLPPYETIETQK